MPPRIWHACSDSVTDLALSFRQVLRETNGFDFAASLDEREAPGSPVPTDFRYKPLVTMVSHHADAIRAHPALGLELGADGSLNGCDVLLQKPINLNVMRTLIEGCGV